MRTLIKQILPATVLVIASFTFASTAANDAHRLSIGVHYDDLDLSSTTGAETLKRRISNAAARVCSSAYASDALTMSKQRTCIRRATDKALSEVKWPSN